MRSGTAGLAVGVEVDAIEFRIRTSQPLVLRPASNDATGEYNASTKTHLSMVSMGRICGLRC